MPRPSLLAPGTAPSRRRLAQSGAGMVEFAVTAVPILLLGLGGMELARWFYMKQALSLALLDAARAGITQHARPQAIKDAFEIALRPLYPPAAAQTSAQRVRHALDERHQAIRQAPWRIQVLDPAAAAFADFADPGLGADRRAINNDYQREQHMARQGAGWTGGRGPASGQTIYQANALTLALTYPVEPLVPGLRPLLRLLGSGTGNYGQRVLAGGYLPMAQEIRLTMQSHPMEWPDLPDGTVVHGNAVRLSTGPPAGADAPCRGLWCPGLAGPGRAGAAAPAPTDAGEGMPVGGETLADAPAETPGAGPGSPAGDSGLETLSDDPACGLTLCCAG